jgi:hypothetical protein
MLDVVRCCHTHFTCQFAVINYFSQQRLVLFSTYSYVSLYYISAPTPVSLYYISAPTPVSLYYISAPTPVSLYYISVPHLYWRRCLSVFQFRVVNIQVALQISG